MDCPWAVKIDDSVSDPISLIDYDGVPQGPVLGP